MVLEEAVLAAVWADLQGAPRRSGEPREGSGRRRVEGGQRRAPPLARSDEERLVDAMLAGTFTEIDQLALGAVLATRAPPSLVR